MGLPPLVLRKEDYPSTGLGTKEALETLFRPLNAALAQLQGGQGSALSAGSNLEFKTVVVKTPSTDWTAVSSFTNSWVAYGGGRQGPQYRKRADGVVELGGEMKSGTIGSAAFTLPAGFWPPVARFLPAYNYTGAAAVLGNVDVSAAGVVTPALGNNTEFSLDGVAFACSDNSPGVLGCFPVTVSTIVSQPTAVLLAALVDQTTAQAIAAPGSLHWKSFGNGQFQILNLPGLSLGRTYQATLLIASG